MKMRIWICAAVLTGGVVSTCLGEADLNRLVQGNTAFALELYSKLGRTGNVFFSPYSISAALAMTYGGGRGITAAEMEKALHFDLGPADTHSAFRELQTRLEALEEKGGIRLAIANSLWPQKGYPFLQEYLNVIKSGYGAEITPLDFQGETEGARITINRWVEEKTREKIKDLIAPGNLDPLTRLILVNAIYFKGSWASQFKPEQTAPADFFVTPDAPVQVPLMEQVRKFPYAEFDDCQVVKLPYAGNGLSMLVVLPRAKDGLATIESQLSTEKLTDWRAALAEREVRVCLPKFKLTWGAARLNEPLQALGMADAFSDARADFSGMDGQRNWLYIGLVLHKAFVEVNEEGTEAAAATAVVAKARAVRPTPPPEFRADHPFLFLIQEEETGAILFLGRMADPTKTE
mgnify:CR=1 FL=1